MSEKFKRRGKGRQSNPALASQKPLTPKAASAAWRWSPLFPRLSGHILKALDMLPEALALVWPLNRARREALPRDIQALSGLLTTGRSQLDKPYWSRPAFISAYLYYFLPWNLIRLGRLMGGLPLAAPEKSLDFTPLLLDAGSGPLVLPLALWLAKPDWRELPVRVLALDKARRPLELGLGLFNTLAQMLEQPAWPVRIASGPIEALARQAANAGEVPSKKTLRPWLISAANVLNETDHKKRGSFRFCGNPDVAWDAGAEYERSGADSFQDEILADLLEKWSPLWESGHAGAEARPNLLFVEPGTRFGGNAIMRLRKAALAMGLEPVAPCVHDRRCPLLHGEGRGGSSFSGSWCHFVFGVEDAPAWLLNLSREAGLAKTSLSLAPLLLKPKAARPAPGAANCLAARVISGAFAVGNSRARYACANPGRCLLENALDVPSGALVQARVSGRHDAKSCAPVLEPCAQPARRHCRG